MIYTSSRSESRLAGLAQAFVEVAHDRIAREPLEPAPTTQQRVPQRFVDAEPVASYYPSAGQYWLAFRPISMAAVLLAGQFLLTSPIYPIEFTDAIVNQTAPSHGLLTGYGFEEAIINDTAARDGGLDSIAIVTSYEDAIENDTDPNFGLLVPLLITNNVEDAIINDTLPAFGLLDGALLRYENYQDAIINDTDPQDGTLV